MNALCKNSQMTTLFSEEAQGHTAIVFLWVSCNGSQRGDWRVIKMPGLKSMKVVRQKWQSWMSPDLITVLAEVISVGFNDGQCQLRNLLQSHLRMSFRQMIHLRTCAITSLKWENKPQVAYDLKNTDSGRPKKKLKDDRQTEVKRSIPASLVSWSPSYRVCI